MVESYLFFHDLIHTKMHVINSSVATVIGITIARIVPNEIPLFPEEKKSTLLSASGSKYESIGLNH